MWKVASQPSTLRASSASAYCNRFLSSPDILGRERSGCSDDIIDSSDTTEWNEFAYDRRCGRSREQKPVLDEAPAQRWRWQPRDCFVSPVQECHARNKDIWTTWRTTPNAEHHDVTNPMWPWRPTRWYPIEATPVTARRKNHIGIPTDAHGTVHPISPRSSYGSQRYPVTSDDAGKRQDKSRSYPLPPQPFAIVDALLKFIITMDPHAIDSCVGMCDFIKKGYPSVSWLMVRFDRGEYLSYNQIPGRMASAWKHKWGINYLHKGNLKIIQS